MATYIGWGTATSLFLAYETLAREHKKAMRLAPFAEGN